MNIDTSDRNWPRAVAFAVLVLAGVVIGEILLILIGNVAVDGLGAVPTLSGFIATLGVASIVLAIAGGV